MSPFASFNALRLAVSLAGLLWFANLSANDSGTLRDASGAIMRGAPMVLGKQLPGALTVATDGASWTTLKNEGFNTVRVCWVDPWYVDRDWPHWTVTEVLPHLDTVVQRARESGLNLIINYHNVGGQNETIDFTLLAEFWEAVASRYADEPNVFYEITNEPTFNGSRYLIPEFRAGLLAIYDQVRRDAPDRQVLMFSFNSLNHDMAGIVAAYADALDWSHTSIAYHMYTGAGGEITSSNLQALSREYRLICTEWDYPGRWDYVPVVDGDTINAQTLERLGHSWIDWRDWGDTDHARLLGITIPDAKSKSYWWGEYLTQPTPGHLSNLSARGWAGTGDATLIVGYVTRGDSIGTMPVLMRGVGPTLREAPYGLTTAITDPQLTIYRGADPIGGNDNWGGGNELMDTFNRLGAFGLIPTAADAATLGEISPSQPRTVHIGPARDDPGVALAELYDASQSPGSPNNPVRLSNLSVRAVVSDQTSQLIGGFVITGNVPRQILLRGVGPTLSAAPYNLSTAIADPQLLVFRADGLFLQGNDNWAGNAEIAAAAATVGAFPLAGPDFADAALLLELSPGAYTVHLVGRDGSGGVGLVEVYELP